MLGKRIYPAGCAHPGSHGAASRRDGRAHGASPSPLCQLRPLNAEPRGEAPTPQRGSGRCGTPLRSGPMGQPHRARLWSQGGRRLLSERQRRHRQTARPPAPHSLSPSLTHPAGAARTACGGCSRSGTGKWPRGCPPSCWPASWPAGRPPPACGAQTAA